MGEGGKGQPGTPKLGLATRSLKQRLSSDSEGRVNSSPTWAQPRGLTTVGVLVCPGRVQQEIDEVIGQARQPEMGDQAQMPFTMAVLHEVQRFGDIIPLGVPHMTSRDTEVQGFLIPKVGLWPSSPLLSTTHHLVALAWPLPHSHRHPLAPPG